MPIPGAGAASFPAIYRATVLSSQDPAGRGRVQVMVPAIAGQGSGWAAGCFAPGAAVTPPKVGDTVFVMFENGDPAFPVWLGITK